MGIRKKVTSCFSESRLCINGIESKTSACNTVRSRLEMQEFCTKYPRKIFPFEVASPELKYTIPKSADLEENWGLCFSKTSSLTATMLPGLGGDGNGRGGQLTAGFVLLSDVLGPLLLVREGGRGLLVGLLLRVPLHREEAQGARLLLVAADARLLAGPHDLERVRLQVGLRKDAPALARGARPAPVVRVSP